MARQFFVLFLLLTPLFAQSLNVCKLRLADQSDFTNNRGFILYLESIESVSGTPCRISNMKLVLAVGDGQQFRYIINSNTNWQQDRDYTVRAEIRNGTSQIFLDSTPLESQPTSFVAASSNILAMNRVLFSESGRTELFWLNSQTTVTSGGNSANLFMPPFPLQLYDRLRDTRGTFSADSAQGVTITARIRMASAQDPQAFGPFVDRYGQSTHANYNKIAADSDFAARNAEEQGRNNTWLATQEVDNYGAPVNPPWTDTATGYYRVKKINTFWWLLSPEGKPVFYIGLNALPAIYDPLAASTVTSGREWLFAEQPPTAFRDVGAGRSFYYNWNLSRKYGDSWEISTWNRTMDRIRAWGFSGASKWKSAAPQGIASAITRQGVTPEIPVLPIWLFGPNVVTAPGINGAALPLPDVFDAGVRAQLDSFLNARMGNRKTDPYVVGWSLGNEVHGIVTAGHVRNLLANPAQSPAKIALIDFAIDTIYAGNLTALTREWQVFANSRAQLYGGLLPNIPAKDVAPMRLFFQRNLLRTYYEAMKRLDPNHLYFGFWVVPDWMVENEDWKTLAEATDVIGYDHYTPTHVSTYYGTLSGTIDKPMFNGEFSFPATYGGQRGFNTAFPGTPGVAAFDEAETAARYTAFLQAARQDRNLIGVGYFAYIDQMITGRSSGDPFGTSRSPVVLGENFAFGLVDVSDTPKQALVAAVRAANREATSTRLALTGPIVNTTFTVRVNVSGGGSVSGSVPCTSQCSQVFSIGTQISLTANPDLGRLFTGWSGPCSGAGSCTFTLNSDVTIDATFSGTGGGGTSASLHFLPINPCRLVDTRNPSSVLGGPALAANETRSFPFLVGSCGLPVNVAAYSLNVTVVPRGLLGYITIWPTGQPQPVVSTLNSLDGRIKANAAIVPAGLSGNVSVFTTNQTDIIIDVNGAFVPTGTNTAAQAFYPVTPCRVADTRLAPGSLGQPALAATVTRSFPVRSSNCGIPVSATAYSLNVTVVPGKPLGYLSLWPTGQAQPVVSTLNALTGTVVANAAIVPAGSNGAVSVFATDSTEFIMDINGYFAAPGSNGLSFFAVNPCRVLDTRNASGILGGPIQEPLTTREFPVVSSPCGIPSGARAYSMNATVLPATSLGYLTLWPTGTAQPVVSTLNAIDGSIMSNAAVVPAGLNGAVSTFVTERTHLILDINGYFGQ